MSILTTSAGTGNSYTTSFATSSDCTWKYSPVSPYNFEYTWDYDITIPTIKIKEEKEMSKNLYEVIVVDKKGVVVVMPTYVVAETEEGAKHKAYVHNYGNPDDLNIYVKVVMSNLKIEEEKAQNVLTTPIEVKGIKL